MSGLDCWACGMSDAHCNERAAQDDSGCCSTCYFEDTHSGARKLNLALLESRLSWLVGEWKCLAGEGESPAQRTLSEAADDLRAVLSGEWPYRACVGICVEHVAHCLHCGNGMNPGDPVCCPQVKA